MIVLDTHIWVWWVNESEKLQSKHLEAIKNADSLCVSAISCWEIAKLVELGRITLSMEVLDWLHAALAYPKIQLLLLTPQIVVESTRLPAPFHKDPSDQIIVATARLFNCPLLTVDAKILAYPNVQTI